MASIPFATFVAAPQTSEPLFLGSTTPQPTSANSGESRGESFRDLLRSDHAQRPQAAEQRPAEPERRSSDRQDETQAAATAASATSALPQDDRPRGEEVSEERGQSLEETRADASDHAGNRERPAESAPQAPNAEADEPANQHDDLAAAMKREEGEKPTKPRMRQHDPVQKPTQTQQAAAQAEVAKHHNPKPTAESPTAQAVKPQGPAKAEVSEGKEAAVAKTTKTTPEQVLADAPAEPVDAVGAVAQDATANADVEIAAHGTANTANNGGAEGGEGAAVSKLHSTVVGSSVSGAEPGGEVAANAAETSDTQPTAKPSAEPADQRTTPGRANAAANGPANNAPSASETGSAPPAAPTSTSTAAPAPTPPTTSPVTGTEVAANPASQEVAQTVSADASMTGENADSTGPTERTDSTLRTQATRGEATNDGQLSVADRVRMVQRVAAALEAAQGRGGGLRMRLEPPELGSIRVELSSEGGSIKARIEAESTHVQRLLLESLPQLRERLAEQQIKIEHFQVDLMNQHDRQFAHMRHDQHERPSGEARPTSQRGQDSSHGERGEQHREAPMLRQQMPWELDRLNVLV